MRHLSTALAAIGFSASALAALPATTDPTLVSVPQLPGGFVIGGSAYYLQSSSTNGDLAFASHNFFNTFAFTPITFNFGFGSFLKEFDPGYDWGWGVNIGYIFPQTGNDINLSYFQLDSDSDHDFDFGAFGGFYTPVNNQIFPVLTFNPIFGTDAFARFAFSHAEYELHQVDLTVGQYIDVGCRLILHPNVGLRWAQLERKLDTHFIAPFTGGEILAIPFSAGGLDGFFNTFEKSDFKGIGPIVGLDASYYIYMGFGAVAHMDSALLAGNISTKTHNNYFSGGANPITIPGAEVIEFPRLSAIYDIHSDDVQRIVPVVDMKLGLDYTYLFNNSANSDLTLEVGWHFSNYFNAIDRVATAGIIIPPPTPIMGNLLPGFAFPSVVTKRTTADYAIQGPYASLVLHI